MNKHILTLSLIILFLIVIIGCTINKEEGIKDPKTLLKELNQKNILTQYRISGGFNTSLGNKAISTNLKISRFENIIKYVVSSQYSTQNDILLKWNDFKIYCGLLSCRKISYPGMDYKNYDYDGDFSTDPNFFDFLFPYLENNTKGLNITLNKDKSFIERPCNDFFIKIDGDFIQNNRIMRDILQGFHSPFADADYEFCLDKEFGFVSYYTFSLNLYNPQTNEKVNGFIRTFEINSFSKNVNAEDVNIPHDFLVDSVRLKRNSLDVKITPLKDSNVMYFDINVSTYIPNKRFGDLLMQSTRFDPLSNREYEIRQNVFEFKDIRALESRSISFLFAQPLKGINYNVGVCSNNYCVGGSFDTISAEERERLGVITS